MARDRTARNRIRQHLSIVGPTVEHSGHATGALMEAIDYQGSPVAFIQLIAAMDRDGEIVRKIKGKRTYEISVSEKVRAMAKPSTPPAAETFELDYDRLARAIVREVVRALDLPARHAAEPTPTVSSTNGTDQRIAYTERLERARVELDLLLRDVSQDETVGAGS